MAEAFEEAANRLHKSARRRTFFNWVLPVGFLRRHAVELFLKSMIVTFDRRFGAIATPAAVVIVVDGKPLPITRVHGIGLLYKALRDRIAVYENEWRAICATDWSDFPADLDRWVHVIDDTDRRGTFFRYPEFSEEDERKSMFQTSHIGEVFAAMAPGKPYRKAFLVLSEDDSVSAAYMMNSSALEEESRCLRDATECLSTAHYGLRMELASGW